MHDSKLSKDFEHEEMTLIQHLIISVNSLVLAQKPNTIAMSEKSVGE